MKNWKTSLIGLGFGILNVVDAVVKGNVDTNTAIMSIGIATLGLLAKDYDKSNSSNPGETKQVK